MRVRGTLVYDTMRVFSRLTNLGPASTLTTTMQNPILVDYTTKSENLTAAINRVTTPPTVAAK